VERPALSYDLHVREDGKIPVPLLDDVAAAGSTICELDLALEDALSKHITAPDVSVQLLYELPPKLEPSPDPPPRPAPGVRASASRSD
jgi:hypothetical protein